MSLWAKNKKQNLLPLSFHCLELSYINPYASKTGKYNLCSQRWEKRFWQVFVTLLWGFKILFLDLIFFFLNIFVSLNVCGSLCMWLAMLMSVFLHICLSLFQDIVLLSACMYFLFISKMGTWLILIYILSLQFGKLA